MVPEDIMTDKNRILHSIDALFSELEGKVSPQVIQFFKVLREFYESDADIPSVPEIPLDKILERLKSLDPSIDTFAFSNTSLRSSLNDALLELSNAGKNPFAIAVGPKSTLIAQVRSVPARQEPETRRVFKTSEITFNLPEELRRQFEEQVELLKKEEEKTNQKVRDLLKKEAELEAEKNRIESQSLNFQADFKEESRKLSEKFESERKQANEEISKLKESLTIAQNLEQELLSKHKKSLDEFVESRSKIEESFSTHERVFQSKFDEMTRLMEALSESEKELSQKVINDRQRLSARDRISSETLEEAQAKLKSLNDDLDDLRKDRKNIRVRYKAEVEAKKKELDQEFTRRSEYHLRRIEEWEEEENRLNRENEQLRVREQSLSVEIKSKTDEHFRERQATLDQLEAKLNKSQKEILKQERELARDKEGLKMLLKQLREKTIDPEILTSILNDQEKITRRKKKILKSIEDAEKQARGDVDEKIKAIEAEKKIAFTKLDPVYEELKSERQRLMKKESVLVKREAEELKRLQQEYEELKSTFEVDQIEKEMKLDEREDQLFEEEEEIFQTRDKILQEESQIVKKRMDNDVAIESELEEMLAIKATTLENQSEINSFLENFQKTYSDIIEVQQQDYETFKSRISEIEEMAAKVAESLKEHEAQSREISSASEQALQGRLEKKEELAARLEKELREKMNEYKSYMEDLTRVKEEVAREGENQKRELLESVSHYEDKLQDLGQAFEELSNAFHTEKEKGRIEIKEETDDRKPLEFDAALAQAEWPLAVRSRLGNISQGENPPHVEEYIYKLSDAWTLWIPVQPGKFQMGSSRPKDYAPQSMQSITKPFRIMKYPVTNVEFFRFVVETNYKTSVEGGIGGVAIVGGNSKNNESFSNPALQSVASAFWLQPDGFSESLYGKFNHPVTQVTWQDALAYCEWKSEAMGQRVRLPTEAEWEYVARNFGEARTEDFYWSQDEISKHCNIEETGIGDTTPVDFFPESELIGGICDLFGNVFEWTADTKVNSRIHLLEQKSVRGGSFITPASLIAPWRRYSFASNYGSAFLGFRAVLED